MRTRRTFSGFALVATFALVAGCGVGPARQGTVGARGAASPAGAAHSETTRQQRAEAYAATLSTDGPRIAGETTLTTVPAKLKNPGQIIGVSNLVVRKSYWSVSGSALAVYQALKKTPGKQLQLSGYGKPGAASGPKNLADLFYTRSQIPSYLDEAELYVEILGRSDGTSDIAAFAEVVPYPVRTADEVVPADAKATASRSWASGADKPPLRTVPLTAAKARQLVAVFNAAKVSPPGACIGAPGPTFGYAAVMTAGGDTWRFSWDGLENCDQLIVTRDGKVLPNLKTPQKLLQLLKADIAGLDGYLDGGLYQVKDHSLYPLRGTISLRHGGKVVATFHADRAFPGPGYEFIVRPGHYTLTGYSPSFEHGATCHAQHVAQVRKDRVAHDDIRCKK